MTEHLTGQDLDDRLRFLLTGDDGSVAFYRTAALGLSGTVVHRIKRATQEWASASKGESDIEAVNDAAGITSTDYQSVGTLLWSNRFALPLHLRSSLEAHVANYREPAKSTTVDETLRSVADAIRRKSPQADAWLEVEYTADGVRWRLTEDPNREWRECTYDEWPETVKRAAVVALEAMQ